MVLEQYIAGIERPDTVAEAKATARLDSLVKPPGSLGELERIAAKLSGISGQMHYYNTQKRCVIIMVADNGVTAEGVASAPQAVTHAQTLNFTRGITGINALAKQFNTDLIIVDTGINGDIAHPMIRNKKIRKSTGNIKIEAAMSRAEAEQAVLTGIETAIEAVKSGYTLLGAGEMGIGNTTTSAAVLCAFTGVAPVQAVGRGAGLTEAAYLHKIEVVKESLAFNRPDPADPLDVLAKVGGLDIAAMAGVFLGGAYMRVPVVIDGFISSAAALTAAKLNPLVKEYMFASHASLEPGAAIVTDALGLRPCLHMDMRLGEGSGCPLMFMVIDAACAVMRDMGTFEEGNIGEEYLDNLTEGTKN